MATKPDFLNDSLYPFRYLQNIGITDVATCITDIRAELVTGLGWSEPSTALFKSPPDAGGKYIDILVTKIGTTNLEFRVRDWRFSTVLTRRVQTDATATVNYYSTVRGLIVESLRATPEMFEGFLLDPTPDLPSDVDNRVIGHGYRRNDDAVDGIQPTCGEWLAVDNGVPSSNALRLSAQNGADSAGANRVRQTGANTLIYSEAMIRINQNGVNRWTGRPWHVLLCDSSLAFGTEKTVPLGDGTTGTFKVISLPTRGTVRMMARKS